MNRDKENRESNIDMETAAQLLHDLGEVDESFIEKAADTDIAVTTGGRRISWVGVFAAAAAVFVGVMVVKNIPEKSNDPFTPALTDVSVTEPAVSEADGSVTDVSSDKSKAPVVTVIETVISEMPGVSGKANVLETSAEEKKVSEDVSSSVTEAVSEKNENTDSTAYPYPEDIKADHAKVTKNSDGTLRVTLDNGRFAITLPSYWEGHFIVTDHAFCAKKSFNESSGNGGELFSYNIRDFSDEEELYGSFAFTSNKFAALRGVSGGRYLETVRVTDARYDTDNEEAKSEYMSLDNASGDMARALQNTESLSDQSGRMEKIMYIPDTADLKAHIERPYNYQTNEQRAGEAINYTSYDDDYVLNGASKEGNEYWPLEEGWNVTVKRAVQNEDGLFYDCYDSEDGDHYKWVSAYDISFELASGH